MPIKRFRFKKLFVALSLFFVLIPSYGRGWHLMRKGPERSDFYQIMPSDQDSQYLKVWWWIILRDKIKIKGALMDNTQFLYEVDCKNHFLRYLSVYVYNEAELIGQSRLNEDLQPALPDSLDNEFIQTVCNKPQNDFFEPVEVDIKKELSSLRDQSAIEKKHRKSQMVFSLRNKN